MGQARFVFTALWSTRHRAALSTYAVPTSRPAADAHRAPDPQATVELPGTLVCWRLLSANNRQLGRSAGAYDDLPSCRAALARLIDGSDSLEPLVFGHLASQRWTWQLLLGDEPVGLSGRSFETERQALRTLGTFLDALARRPSVDPAISLPAPRVAPFPTELIPWPESS